MQFVEVICLNTVNIYVLLYLKGNMWPCSRKDPPLCRICGFWTCSSYIIKILLSSLSQLDFPHRPSAAWSGPTTCLLLTGKCCTTWVWYTWQCSSTLQPSTSSVQPSTWTHEWGNSTCCWQVELRENEGNNSWLDSAFKATVFKNVCSCSIFVLDLWWKVMALAFGDNSVTVYTCFIFTVALTNLEDMENATRAYEQAVTLDESVFLPSLPELNNKLMLYQTTDRSDLWSDWSPLVIHFLQIQPSG